MINIVQHTGAHFEREQIAGGLHQIVASEHARLFGIFEAEFLANLVTAYAAEIIAFGIKEQTLEQRAAVGHCGRIAGAQAAVNFLQGFLLVVSRILLHALDDEPLVAGGVHHANLILAHRRNLLEHRLGQRLKSARHNHVFLRVHRVLHQHEVGEMRVLLSDLEGYLLDVVK